MTRQKAIAAKAALALLAPWVALMLAEGALRLARIGLPTRFLVQDAIQGTPCWVNNPFYGYRFFPPELARNPGPITIEQDKPAGLVRIAVLGESAAQGDPLLEFGLPRLLEKMLGEMDGRHRYEVVNAAMTAINSAVITDIARDLRCIRPDVVILYIGNNEVIGPYGPGTSFTSLSGAPWLAAFRVRLTRLRLAQWLRPRRPGSPQAWAGLDLFAGLHFPEGDPRLEPMYQAFRQHLTSIIRTCQSGGARVILSTVAVNLADCAPFGSETPDALPPEDRQAWQAAFEAGAAAQARQDWNDARQAYQTASRLFDRHAGLAYRRAHLEQMDGQLAAARDLFRRARDLDTQRFRTDSRLNRIVREVARQTSIELVDAEAAFDAFSPAGGGPGDDLFLDHVHFTFEGAWRLAGLFAPRLCQKASAEIPSLETCRRLMFFNPYSERQQATLMLERRRRPPFKTQPGNDRQISRLYEASARCSARIAETPLAELEASFRQLTAVAPRDFFIPFLWGSILAGNNQWAEAGPILVNAQQRVPHHFEARVLPALALCRVNQITEAARLIAGPSGPYGRYLAENALAVLRALEGAGQIDAARRFRIELLELAPRFPLRRAIAAYPIGSPKT